MYKNLEDYLKGQWDIIWENENYYGWKFVKIARHFKNGNVRIKELFIDRDTKEIIDTL